jgi:hypothetical protein
MFRYASIFFVLLVNLLLFNSCKKQNDCDCIKSRGAPTSETHVINTSFTMLQVFDKVDVYYIQDTNAINGEVKIVTGKNLVSNISTEVVDGVLQIKDNNKCNFVRTDNSVTVYVTAPHVYFFIQEGVGTLYTGNTIKQDSVVYSIRNSGDVHLNVNTKIMHGSVLGVGDIYLSGKVQFHLSNMIGECFMYAQDLQVVNYCFLDYKSTGEARVNVSGGLDVVLNYTGNIYYTGNPSVIHKSGSGNGQLIKN